MVEKQVVAFGPFKDFIADAVLLHKQLNLRGLLVSWILDTRNRCQANSKPLKSPYPAPNSFGFSRTTPS